MTSEQNRPALRPPAGGMITINVANEIAQLKSTPEWKFGDRHALSLVKNAPLSILLMILKEGVRLSEHRTKGPITVQVVSGSIRFNAVAERIVSAGEMIALDSNIAHSL